MLTTIFNDGLANIVQTVSLPLELVGLTLAFIEIRKPELADFIEHVIDQVANMPRIFKGPDDRASMVWYFACGTFLCCFSAAAIWFLFRTGGHHWNKPNNGLPESVLDSVVAVASFAIAIIPIVFVICWLIIVALMLYISIVECVSLLLGYLDKYANGRALGAFGLLMASVGVLGEAYQVLTLSIALVSG